MSLRHSRRAHKCLVKVPKSSTRKRDVIRYINREVLRISHNLVKVSHTTWNIRINYFITSLPHTSVWRLSKTMSYCVHLSGCNRIQTTYIQVESKNISQIETYNFNTTHTHTQKLFVMLWKTDRTSIYGKWKQKFFRRNLSNIKGRYCM